MLGNYINLAGALATLPLLAASSPPLLAPRATTTAPIPTSTNCTAIAETVYEGAPTVPPEYESWASSAWSTATDSCHGITVPSSIASYFNGWRSSDRSWSSAHESEIGSYYSVCSDYVDSLILSQSSAIESRHSFCASTEHGNTTTDASGTGGGSATPGPTDSSSSPPAATTTGGDGGGDGGSDGDDSGASVVGAPGGLMFCVAILAGLGSAGLF